jgi:electron transfer flavoprotein alpha subunit
VTSTVVCTWELDRDGLPVGAEEVLTLARRTSAALGAELRWLVLGSLPTQATEIAARYGVTAVDRIAGLNEDAFEPDASVEALARYCAERSPKALLFPQTYDVRLVAPRLAGRLGCGIVMNVVDAGVGEAGLQVTTSAYGGDTRVIYEFADADPCLLSVMANAIAPQPIEGSGSRPMVEDLQLERSRTEERIRVVERARSEGPRLEDAEIIVAGGRGLGDQGNYKLIEELAEALGGMAGASRPLVDDGWVDPSRQVGLTGKITRPGLYIAAGISGASQHMAGCSAAGTIVAINRDPDAAIFRHASYGIVGDCIEILPELIRSLKGR